MNSVHDKEYKTQLSDFFRNLGGEVDDSIKVYKVGLTNFFASLSPAVDIATRAQAELDRIAATRFSVFGYFRERETDLSRIFADVLNPSGIHGQGERFLKLFLDELTRAENKWPENLKRNLPYENLQGCIAHLEYPTKGGRQIDIVLEISGGNNHNVFLVGIENKPWAKDEEEQVGDYLKDLLEKSPERAWMLYFSGDGKEPSEYSLGRLNSQGRELCLTVPYRRYDGEYPSLENWVQQCWERCEAERVRWFLKDLLEYIKSQFENSAHTEPETGEGKA